MISEAWNIRKEQNMLFENMVLSRDTVRRLGEKTGLEVKDEDTLCFAIRSVLEIHDQMMETLKKHGINAPV